MLGAGCWVPGAGCIDEGNRILQHRHHPEAEEIHFHDPHVGAIVLVPLDDDATGHAGVFEWNDRVELPLADDHPAGMLAKMPRQILHLAPEAREQPDTIRMQIQADRREMPRQRIGRIGELEVVHHLREAIDLKRLEPERLPHFARGAPPAIRDDVGGHCRAQAAVFLVHVLDDPLAAIAAR